MEHKKTRGRRAVLRRISDAIVDRLALASEVTTTDAVTNEETEGLFRKNMRVVTLERRLAEREGN